MEQGMGMNPEWAAEVAKEQEEYKWQAAHAPKLVPIDTSGLRRKSNDPQLAQRQAALLGQVFSLQGEIDSVSKAVTAAEVVELRKQHKSLWAQARKAKDALSAKAKPIAHAENIERETGFAYLRESAQLESVYASIPNIANYPTDEEYREWEVRVEQQKKKLEGVGFDLDGAKQYLQELLYEQNELKAAFDQVKAAVDASQARIDLLEGKKSAPSSIKFSGSIGLGG